MIENLNCDFRWCCIVLVGVVYSVCVLSFVLSSLSWLSNGGLDGQFGHDLIDMAYDLTEVFDEFSCLVSLWRGLWLR